MKMTGDLYTAHALTCIMQHSRARHIATLQSHALRSKSIFYRVARPEPPLVSELG